MNNLELYIISFGMPLAGFGMYKLMKLLTDVINYKRGKVKAIITTESGMLKEKWVKPISGQIKGKSGSSQFKYDVGYVWRKGFFPVTIIDGKNQTQINLLSETRDDTGAKDASNLIIRSYNEGYIDGFKKNKMINNMMLIVLLASAMSALFGILVYQQTTQILNIVGAG